MRGYIAGGISALLLVAAGFFIWKSQAGSEDPVPRPPQAVAADVDDESEVTAPPAASEKTREEKRFGRADKDKDGRITLDELYQPRRKAFAKLDTNSDGRLSFEEWAVSTTEKFSGADADRSGSLTPTEFATTRPKTKARPKRCAC